MPKNHPSFRCQFSLRGLLLAGAVTSLGLPLGQNAYGIGGSAIQAAYTPRESVGAAPTVSLISSGSSNAAAIASSGGGGGGGDTATQGGGGSRAPRSVSSEDEGNGTTKRRHPRKSTEEGSTKRVARQKGGQDTYEAKDQKDRSKEIPLIAPVPKPLFTLSTGFESRYIYHGVDIVGFNSTAPNGAVSIGGTSFNLGKFFTALSPLVPHADRTSPVYYFNGNVEYKGFRLGVGYIQATNLTIPTRETIANQAAVLNRFFNLVEGFATPISSYQKTRRYYKEVDINADYTLGIIANVLDATVGYNSYIFPDHDFKGTNYQGEAFGRLTLKASPYIRPSITYFRYISDARAENINFDAKKFEFTATKLGEYLNGNYIEARLDGAFPIVNSAAFSLAFAPYALISVNDGYLTKQVNNQTRLEFNTVEFGVKLPATYGGHFTVTPYVNYGFDISTSHNANDFRGHIAPFKEDVWGGVTLSYSF